MTAYYNEWEPYPAQWLRNLIKAGLIASGDVDERSIKDVKPDDLKGYTQCHFFAGIGGWSYALRLAGWDDSRPIWTGSCPCQPFACSGKRQGHADDRHLWPSFHCLIAECRPSIIFGEQVASKDGREWLSAVRLDLENAGYAVGAANLSAASVGAPHERQRHFFVADASSGQQRQETEGRKPRNGEMGSGATKKWKKIGLLPTVTKRDERMDKWSPAYERRKSPSIDALSSKNGRAGMVDLAALAGWMMGYPRAWLNQLWEASATPLSRKSPKRS